MLRVLSRFPIIAIGGINNENFQSVLAKGATSIAVISAIQSAKNPRQASAELARLIQKYKTEHQNGCNT